MEKTIEKAKELQATLPDEQVDGAFESITTLTLADAIRLGARNTVQAHGWGDGESQCALHAAVSAGIATGFIEVE